MTDGQAAPVVTPAALAPWVEDTYAGCIALVAAARGIPSRVVMAARWPGSPPTPWLAFRVGARDYLFRLGTLLAGGRGDEIATFTIVNGDMPALTANKAATRLAVAAVGGSIAEGRLFRASAIVAAVMYFRSLRRPVCLKPNGARAGIGVHPRVVDETTFVAAFRSIGRDHREILVEEHVMGTALRCQYTRPSVVGVRIDRPASVLADGVRTIAALVADKNADPRRSSLPNHSPIPLLPENVRQLRAQGFGVDDVPPVGRRVYLSAQSNMEAGADCLSWPEQVHPSYRAEVERVCRAFVPYRFGAIDLIVRDVSVPAAPGNHWILEINSAPGFTSFYLPLEGTQQDVCGDLLDRLRDEQW